MPEMFLYVWDRHFYDHEAGLAVVLAPDAETARTLLEKKVGYHHDDIDDTPHVYGLSEPVAFYVHGGQ